MVLHRHNSQHYLRIATEKDSFNLAVEYISAETPEGVTLQFRGPNGLHRFRSHEKEDVSSALRCKGNERDTQDERREECREATACYDHVCFWTPKADFLSYSRRFSLTRRSGYTLRHKLPHGLRRHNSVIYSAILDTRCVRKYVVTGNARGPRA